MKTKGRDSGTHRERNLSSLFHRVSPGKWMALIFLLRATTWATGCVSRTEDPCDKGCRSTCGNEAVPSGGGYNDPQPQEGCPSFSSVACPTGLAAFCVDGATPELFGYICTPNTYGDFCCVPCDGSACEVEDASADSNDSDGDASSDDADSDAADAASIDASDE